MNNGTAVGMLGHQPGPVPLFLFGQASWAFRFHYFFFRLAPGLGPVFIFDHGRDFIFRGFRAKGKRSVQLILTEIVCLAGLGCPVSLFCFGLASWAARFHYFFRAGPAGLSGFIIFFGPGRLGWPVSLFIFGIAKNK